MSSKTVRCAFRRKSGESNSHWGFFIAAAALLRGGGLMKVLRLICDIVRTKFGIKGDLICVPWLSLVVQISEQQYMFYYCRSTFPCLYEA